VADKAESPAHVVRCRCGERMELRGEAGLFRCPRAQGLSGLNDPDHPVLPIEQVDPELRGIVSGSH
jgi:hypothetical protein